MSERSPAISLGLLFAPTLCVVAIRFDCLALEEVISSRLRIGDYHSRACSFIGRTDALQVSQGSKIMSFTDLKRLGDYQRLTKVRIEDSGREIRPRFAEAGNQGKLIKQENQYKGRQENDWKGRKPKY